MFDKGLNIEVGDEHGTTLLSEAAAGGAEEVCEMLVGEGADPNSQGRYKRTPLWRAAYAGHAVVVKMLLRAGSDPRTPDEQGSKPWDQANGADVKLLLESWDTSVTDTLKTDGTHAKKAEERAAAQATKLAKQSDELREAI